jgi:outer membrane receptor protein involved in Fe transport
VQQHEQRLDFSGPQNIAGYSISIRNPTWPIDLSALALKPRTLNEAMSERGLALTDAMALSERLHLRLGLRHSSVRIDTANNSPVYKTTVDTQQLTHSQGLSWQASEHNKLWLSRANSFEPGRGLMRSGDYLPAQTAVQYETGWQRSTQGYSTALTLFSIEQSNRPVTDPVDKNYLSPLGLMQSDGLVLSQQLHTANLNVQTNVTVQNARITTPSSAVQGSIVPGVPRAFGLIKITSPEKALGLQTWLSLLASEQKPADSLGSTYATGFTRWDAGLHYKASTAWHLSAGVNNLFDLRYVQALNALDNVWQGPRRSVWVSAQFAH